MSSPATEIARRLADNAEAVCRRYLSNGRREGGYWMVGDIRNSPGRSLYVRLAVRADSSGAAGKWTDAASGDHGDLLDVIAASCGHVRFRETLDEARHFLKLPMPPETSANPKRAKAAAGSPEAARRLWSASRPLSATLAEAYLGARAITDIRGAEALRFHPQCFYRPSEDDVPGGRPAWPALIAAVTDHDGSVTGVHRTWLDPATTDKAAVACPRRAMGLLLGQGVRFGRAGSVMAAGEGIETLLSLRQPISAMPMIAGLSAAHLAAIAFPPVLRRLYVARDDDPAGAAALARLIERAGPVGVEIVPLEPQHGDFNADLVLLGRDRLARSLHRQLEPSDRLRFL
jgi:hypothetical protein